MFSLDHCPNRFYSLLFFILIVSVSVSAKSELRNLPSVTILAASSISVPLQFAIRAYVQEKGISVTASYDDASLLASQISQGKEADLFISSHPKWVTELKQKGLLDVYSITNLLKNRLALVVSNHSNISHKISKNPNSLSLLQEVIERSVIVVAQPVNTSLGIYTKEALLNANPALWNSVINYAIQGKSSQDVSQLILDSNRAGIVYLSDIQTTPKLRYLASLEENAHSPIIYQAAVVSGKYMENARDFLNFLKEPEILEIFRQYGFKTYRDQR